MTTAARLIPLNTRHISAPVHQEAENALAMALH